MPASATWRTLGTCLRWLAICLLICLFWAPLALTSLTLGGIGHGARRLADRVMTAVEGLRR